MTLEPPFLLDGPSLEWSAPDLFVSIFIPGLTLVGDG
jgi:hypothetical protein